MMTHLNAENLPTSPIFLVEDDVDLRDAMQETLKLADHHVVSAGNPREALDLMKRAPQLPRLIISDLMMPGMNGYQFFKEVRNCPPWNEIPFLFVTGQEATSLVRDPVLGTIAYLSKPFKIVELLSMVDQLVQ